MKKLIILSEIMREDDPQHVDLRKLPKALVERTKGDLPFAWSEEHQDYILWWDDEELPEE